MLFYDYLQAGLYEKWSKDLLAEEAKAARNKRRAENAKSEDDENSSEVTVVVASKSLTLNHLQGALMLVAFGWFLSIIIFSIEKLYHYIYKN